MNSTTGPPSTVLKSPVNLDGSILKSLPINLHPLYLWFSVPIGKKSCTSANELVKLKYLITPEHFSMCSKFYTINSGWEYAI